MPAISFPRRTSDTQRTSRIIIYSFQEGRHFLRNQLLGFNSGRAPHTRSGICDLHRTTGAYFRTIGTHSITFGAQHEFEFASSTLEMQTMQSGQKPYFMSGPRQNLQQCLYIKIGPFPILIL